MLPNFFSRLAAAAVAMSVLVSALAGCSDAGPASGNHAESASGSATPRPTPSPRPPLSLDELTGVLPAPGDLGGSWLTIDAVADQKQDGALARCLGSVVPVDTMVARRPGVVLDDTNGNQAIAVATSYVDGLYARADAEALLGPKGAACTEELTRSIMRQGRGSRTKVTTAMVVALPARGSVSSLKVVASGWAAYGGGGTGRVSFIHAFFVERSVQLRVTLVGLAGRPIDEQTRKHLFAKLDERFQDAHPPA